MQLLSERATSRCRAARIVAVLLFEDLLIVPLLAGLSLASPGGDVESGSRVVSILVGSARSRG